jgi:hypothetical protein
MPATVNVNYLTVVHQSSNGISFAFPDVCKTPTPVGPVPIPYPNIAMSKDTMLGSQTVTMDGNPIMLKGSVYSMSTGDEPGTVGGVVSNVFKGKAEFLNYSFDVKVEGKNVPRLLDPMGQNEASPNNIVGPANLQPPVVAVPGQAAAAAAQLLSARVVSVEFQSGIPLWTIDDTVDPNAADPNRQVPPPGQVHWHAGKKKYPAVYVRDGAAGSPSRDLRVVVEITTDLSGTARLTAQNLDVEVEGTASVSASQTATRYTFNCRFTQLPKTVRLLRYWRFAWHLELAGQTRTLNATLLTLYIVDEIPRDITWGSGDNNKNWYDWVLEFSCSWAAGETGATNVFNAIWNEFSDGTRARVPHATGWAYWQTDDPAQALYKIPYYNRDPDASKRKGMSCRSTCHFFMMAVAVHGMGCVEIVPVGDPEAAGAEFLVAEWTLVGAGLRFPARGPGHYYAGDWAPVIPPRALPDRPGWSPDALPRNRHPGQGQSNPPLYFNNHWIVYMQSGGSGLYDTSYGGAGVPVSAGALPLAGYQPVAISGWNAAIVGTSHIVRPANTRNMILASYSQLCGTA